MASHAGAQDARSLVLAPANGVLRETFTSITSVRELADGRLLVADRVERRLVVTDWTSGEVVQIGRSGQGPGEYRGVGWLFPLANDSTLFTDPLSRRWLLLAHDSVVQTFVSEPVAWGAILSGGDARGRVLGTVASHVSDACIVGLKECADSLNAVLGVGLWNPDERPRLDTITRFQGAGPGGTCVGGMGGTDRRSTCSAIKTQDLVLLSSDGWIAVVRLQPYRVEWRSPEGRWIRGEPIPRTRIPVTEQEKCAFARGWVATDAECDLRMLQAYSWPSEMPPFLPPTRYGRLVGSHAPVLFAAPDGTLVIRRAPSALSPNATYDIIDRSGALVSVLRLSSEQAIVGFGASSVYIAARDEVDLLHLRRHPWR